MSGMTLQTDMARPSVVFEAGNSGGKVKKALNLTVFVFLALYMATCGLFAFAEQEEATTRNRGAKRPCLIRPWPIVRSRRSRGSLCANRTMKRPGRNYSCDCRSRRWTCSGSTWNPSARVRDSQGSVYAPREMAQPASGSCTGQPDRTGVHGASRRHRSQGSRDSGCNGWNQPWIWPRPTMTVRFSCRSTRATTTRWLLRLTAGAAR